MEKGKVRKNHFGQLNADDLIDCQYAVARMNTVYCFALAARNKPKSQCPYVHKVHHDETSLVLSPVLNNAPVSRSGFEHNGQTYIHKASKVRCPFGRPVPWEVKP